MEWRDILTKIAPTALSALAGPLAGPVLAAAGAIFGIDHPTQEKLQKAIESGQMTGEQLTALKQLEMKLQAEEQERGFRYAELEFKDRDSARHRDAEIIKATGHNYRADGMFLLAVIVTCVLVWIVWQDPSINEYVKGIFTLVLGRFLGYLDNIYSFEFGTTRSSQKKTDLLARADAIKE